jgi:hypothetical protein
MPCRWHELCASRGRLWFCERPGVKSRGPTAIRIVALRTGSRSLFGAAGHMDSIGEAKIFRRIGAMWDAIYGSSRSVGAGTLCVIRLITAGLPLPTAFAIAPGNWSMASTNSP